MRVTVLYFGRLRELAGGREWACDVPDGATVADVWRAGASRQPAVAALASSVSCAVNDEFSTMSAPVHDGDEVAFLPPVSGGGRTSR